MNDGMVLWVNMSRVTVQMTWTGFRFKSIEWKSPSGHIQNPSGHQLAREPVKTLMEPHPAAGITALDVPTAPTAQFV